MKKFILVFLIFSLMKMVSFAQITADFSYEPEVCGNQISVTDISSGETVITRAWYKDDVLLSTDGPETYNFSIDALNGADTIMVSLVVQGATSSDSVAHQVICYEQPVIDAGDDFDVCGNVATLSATTYGFPSAWQPVGGVVFEDISAAETDVTYSGYGSVTFILGVTNGTCTALDELTVNFWRQPSAVPLMATGDTTVCGLIYPRLRAENSGGGIDGHWISDPSGGVSFYEDDYIDTMEVLNYGHYTIWWVESTGPDNEGPDFCTDTSEPFSIHFIEPPQANAGTDTIFCGYSGNLNAVLSIDNENSFGSWSSESSNIFFEEINNPESLVSCSILIGDPDFDNIELIWTEDNFGCTSSDTVVVGFVRIPEADFTIIPPRCNGEPASIKAQEDSLQNYDWDFGANCQIDSIWPLNDQGGDYRYFVHWEDEDTAHIVTLRVENYLGCTSTTVQDTVFDPPLASFDVEIAPDTCLLDKGAVTFIPASTSYSFHWLDTVGLNIPDPYSHVQTDLPAGTYDVSVDYPSPNDIWNTQYIILFGSEFCRDTFDVTIDNVGFLNSGFTVSDSIVYLSNPEVDFTYNGDANDNVIWDFGDGNTSDLLNPTHTYQDTGVYTVSLHAYNSDNCGDLSFKTIEVKLGNSINANQHSDIMVYPNPSDGRITIKSEHEVLKQIAIFDVMGNKTDEIIPDNQLSIDITLNGAKGIYLIQLTTEKDIYYQKVVLR
jgi:hypothetical protein